MMWFKFFKGHPNFYMKIDDDDKSRNQLLSLSRWKMGKVAVEMVRSDWIQDLIWRWNLVPYWCERKKPKVTSWWSLSCEMGGVELAFNWNLLGTVLCFHQPHSILPSSSAPLYTSQSPYIRKSSITLSSPWNARGRNVSIISRLRLREASA